MTSDADEPRLLLEVDASKAAPSQARVHAALDATGAVTVILRGGAEGTLRALVDFLQKQNIAVLCEDDVALAQALSADGVHLSATSDIVGAYQAARRLLGPDALIGVNPAASRHDAMELGEAGADYIAFARDLELVAWWADLFTVPVVALGVETPEDAAAARMARADFASILLPGALPDHEIAAWGAQFRAALAAESGTATEPAA